MQDEADVKQRLGAAILATGLAACAVPALAETVSYRFDWQGSGGYSMRGALGFDAELLAREEIRAADLSCFVIEGFHDGAPVGRWALSMLNEETSWVLTFLPRSSEFAVFGPGRLMPQAWNMDGAGTDCGPGGFGFNIGNAAQDLCLNGRLVVESQVAPARPFPARREQGISFPADACLGPMLMSALPARAVPVSFQTEKDPPHGQD
ncbi:hypothetical protein M4578_09135 [Salipiger sp. P9]|uniref:hypothetical protein n=1 Tax=Salipiger pentaromativorans TaxID=2943193 RepID=UPI0021573009|nr:hypothetical protein [Salipiger pentaromativorans]MCR8547990.1 hypothetical protein [Salipiger pentaromativorans]